MISDNTHWLVVLLYITILKNMMEFVNGKDYIPYMKWTIKFHGLKPPSSDKNSDYNSDYNSD